MPLFASNFTSNSLSGTVRVSGGAANINFGIAPFALEGNKTFVVKLRRGSAVGDVIATSNPITINDFSQIISLTANISTVAEGNIVSISLVTANVPNNANVFYSVLPVTANVTASDFLGANAGMATIINNQATFAFYANTDAGYVDETGETFKVQLRTGNTAGNIVYTTANVVVTDFYKLFNVFGLVESSSSIVEGNPVTFTVTAHNVPTGTVLYYDTVGNLTSFSANTGSFIMNGLSNTISITGTNVASNTITDYRLRVRKDSLTGTILATSNTISVLDDRMTYTTASNSGGIVYSSNGYTTVVFNNSGSLTFTGISSILDRNTVEYAVVAGGGAGGYLTGGGAGGLIQGQFKMTQSNLGSYTIQVGSGGAAAGLAGGAGNPSYIQNAGNTIHLSSMGGGGGGWLLYNSPGGSGGGGSPTTATGIPGQGYPGYSSGTPNGAGSGGGAGGAATATAAGPGANISIALGIPASFGQSNIAGRYFAGGGGGGSGSPVIVGGLGGGAPGAPGPFSSVAGNVNTGGGGGSGTSDQPPGNWGGPGGSGIVIIRYLSVAPDPTFTGFYTSANSYTVGSNVIFNVFITNANTYTYYYETVGNVSSSNFVGGNTGTFTASATGATITLQTANVPGDETRYFALQIRDGSSTAAIKATSSNVNISNATVQYLTVSGVSGNVLTANGYTVVVFPTSNTITFSSLGNSPARNTIEYTVIGGGGCGRNYGGGGAGGFITGNIVLAATDTYTITVGAGGVVAGTGSSPTAKGGVSTFRNSSNTINISAMGGGSYESGFGPGGSGAGGGYGTSAVTGQPIATGGEGFNYPGASQQGYPGGNYVNSKGGGGGGAGGAGTNPNPAGTPTGKDGGTGGIGAVVPYSPSFFGTTGPSPGRWFAGGGGGASDNGGPYGGDGGAGGGGHGRLPGGGGITNTGGGGGAYYDGGSGIVIIRYQSAP